MWTSARRSALRLRPAIGLASAGVCLSSLALLSSPKEADSAAPATASKPKTTSVFSWGSNSFGQLGLGTMTDSYIPSAIGSITDPVAVSASGAQTAVIASPHGMCFTFGFAMESNQSIPVVLEDSSGTPVTRVKQAAVGGSHGALVDADGQIHTWGKGWQGQLGRKGVKSSMKAEVVQSEAKFKQVACGDQHTAAVDIDGNVWTWGLGRSGQLGSGSRSSRDEPARVEGLKDIVQVSCGRESTLCVRRDGVVFSFGGNDYGQLGLGQTLDRYQLVPRVIEHIRNEKVVKASAGEYHSAVLTDAGKVYTFGLGKEGQTGQNDRMDISVPKLVKALDQVEVIDVCCGGGHTCALTKDGELWCWGRGRSGQLGFADSVESIAGFRKSPELVPTFKSRVVVDIAVGGDHTVAIVQD